MPSLSASDRARFSPKKASDGPGIPDPPRFSSRRGVRGCRVSSRHLPRFLLFLMHQTDISFAPDCVVPAGIRAWWQQRFWYRAKGWDVGRSFVPRA